jgi:formiminotetrahydrofolate cyclodeaminase
LVGRSGLGIDEALGTIGSRDRAAAGGSAAALAGALAAAVVAKAARASERPGSTAQATLLQSRLVRFAEADEEAFAKARAALAEREPGGGERRDFALGRALRNALLVPLRIGETCADVALLAADERETVAADHQADLAAAAAIAAGAAHGAAHLVAVNLAATSDDPDVVAAHGFASSAADIVRLFGGE